MLNVLKCNSADTVFKNSKYVYLYILYQIMVVITHLLEYWYIMYSISIDYMNNFSICIAQGLVQT